MDAANQTGLRRVRAHASTSGPAVDRCVLAEMMLPRTGDVELVPSKSRNKSGTVELAGKLHRKL